MGLIDVSVWRGNRCRMWMGIRQILHTLGRLTDVINEGLVLCGRVPDADYPCVLWTSPTCRRFLLTVPFG